MFPVADIRAVKVKPKRADAFYLSLQWRSYRDQLIKRRGRRCQDPQCRDPNARGVRYGDHIKERSDGGADFDDDNVLIRCAPCHGRKTEVERAARTARAAAPPR